MLDDFCCLDEKTRAVHKFKFAHGIFRICTLQIPSECTGWHILIPFRENTQGGLSQGSVFLFSIVQVESDLRRTVGGPVFPRLDLLAAVTAVA